MTHEDYEKQLGNDATGRELVRLRRALVKYHTENAPLRLAANTDDPKVHEAIKRRYADGGGGVFVVLPVPTKWDGPRDSWELCRFVAENALFRFGVRSEFVAYLRTSGDHETANDIENAEEGLIPSLIGARGEAFVTFIKSEPN